MGRNPCAAEVGDRGPSQDTRCGRPHTKNERSLGETTNRSVRNDNAQPKRFWADMECGFGNRGVLVGDEVKITIDVEAVRI